MIYFANRCDKIPFVEDAKILPRSFLYYEAVSNLIYGIYDQNTPLNMLMSYQKTSYVHLYNTRPSTLLGLFTFEALD